MQKQTQPKTGEPKTQKQWKAKFTGRTVGAIGISYPIETTVEGETKEQAGLALYERFDHIHRLVLTEIAQ